MEVSQDVMAELLQPYKQSVRGTHVAHHAHGGSLLVEKIELLVERSGHRLLSR